MYYVITVYIPWHPSDWWKLARVPEEISKICRKILACSPSTGSLERLFSTFGWVHSKERNRLGTEKAGKMVFCMKVLNKKWAFVELFPINFLLFVTLYFQASRKGNWVLKIDSMAKNEFQNSPHVLKTRYIMCWWHLNYILRHSEHLWIFTTSFRKKIRKVDLNLDLIQKSRFKSKKSLIWIFLKKIRFFSNPGHDVGMGFNSYPSPFTPLI